MYTVVNSFVALMLFLLFSPIVSSLTHNLLSKLRAKHVRVGSFFPFKCLKYLIENL